jgi:hypothetical protein
MTTGKLYKGKHKQSLGVFYASLFLFYGLLATSLIVNIFTWPIVLGLYLLRLISEVVVYYQSAVKLKSTNMLWALPLLDIMYVSYLLVFGFKGLFTKNPKVW